MKELVVGYDGLITDEIIGLLESAFDNLRLDDIQNIYVGKLNNLYESIKTIHNKKYDEMQTGGSSDENMKKLYNFNLELQRVQKKMNEFFFKWKEYQHYKLRYYNYFLYEIYSLSLYDGKHERTIYQFINREICEKYNNLLRDTIGKFNNIE